MSATVINMAGWLAERERQAIRRAYAGPKPRAPRPTINQLLGFAPSTHNGDAA